MKAYQSLLSLAIASAIVAAPVLASAQTYTAYDLGRGAALGIDGNNVVGIVDPNGNGGAAEWTGTTSSSEIKIDSQGIAYGVSGNTVVGDNYMGHVTAGVWNSPYTNDPGTTLDLGGGSEAYGIAGNLIVGVLINQPNAAIGARHASVWTSQSASSAIDINPSGISESYAQATNGTMIAGYGFSGTPQNSEPNAIVWTGNSAADAININPSGYRGSYAYGISGNNIVGIGLTSNGFSPLLWTGASAGDYTPLNSSGYSQTEAVGIAGNFIVGDGTGSSGSNALLWTGPNFSTLINLSQYLSPGVTQARATGVDAAGDICGYGQNATTGYYEALLWKINPAPEPSMVILPALGFLGILKRKPKA